MSLASSVAGVLRNPPVGHINFRVETITVDKAHMESVAKAIDAGDILVETGSSGPQLGAAYSSYRSRRFAAGEKKLIGKITIGSAGVTATPLGRAAILHESVHALMDVRNLKVSMHDDEVVAYLADAVCLRSSRTTINGGAPEMAIYKAAFAIVDARQMATKPGVALKWSDCDALRTAIKAHPAYR